MKDQRPSHGGYRALRAHQVARDIYDWTVIFCNRFIDRRSRTHDQMVQAARSGCRNIAEGSAVSATSKKMEIKLTNVAKASLEELLLDYEDYLRQHGLLLWSKDSPEALAVRARYRGSEFEPSDGSGQSDASNRPLEGGPYGLSTASAEVAANTLICLIHQATYLLRRQIERLEQDFLEHGGYTERLHRERTAYRNGLPPTPSATAEAGGPACPHCSGGIVQRTARQGPHAGRTFWGCSDYPNCNGTRTT